MRIFLVITIVACLTSATMSEKTNFTGTWTVNLDKSDFGKSDPNLNSARLIVIDQKSEFLILTRTFGDNLPAVETYRFDGTTTDTTIANDYHKTSFIKWSGDEKQFTISGDYKVTPKDKAPYEYTRTEAYSLSGDGKTLTIDRVTVLPDATQTVKAVYDKK